MASVVPFSDSGFVESHLCKARQVSDQYVVRKTKKEEACINAISCFASCLIVVGMILVVVSCFLIGTPNSGIVFFTGFVLLFAVSIVGVEMGKKWDRTYYDPRFQDECPAEYLMLVWWRTAQDDNSWGHRLPRGWANGRLPSPEIAREILKSNRFW